MYLACGFTAGSCLLEGTQGRKLCVRIDWGGVGGIILVFLLNKEVFTGDST